MEPCILALDQGTTSSRALLFDRNRRALGMAQKPFRQIYPKPGWVEHDPMEIWSTQLAAAREAIAEARIDPARIAAIGIANQRETAVFWDRATGEPIGPALVWQDRRTADICRTLSARGLERLVRERTGLLLDPYFSGTKIMWALENVPGDARIAPRQGACASARWTPGSCTCSPAATQPIRRTRHGRCSTISAGAGGTRSSSPPWGFPLPCFRK